MNHTDPAERLLAQAFAKLDKTALGVACGAWLGLGVFAATLILVLKGGEVVGPHLALLGQFFVGYSVTAVGSVVGLAYGFVTGFAVGWAMAFLYNLTIMVYLFLLQFRTQVSSITDYIDPDSSGS